MGQPHVAAAHLNPGPPLQKLRRFELFAIDNGWDDESPIRRRIEAAFDEIVDIAHVGDRQAASMVRQRNNLSLLETAWYG